jgi:hypothetical protein
LFYWTGLSNMWSSPVTIRENAIELDAAATGHEQPVKQGGTNRRKLQRRNHRRRRFLPWRRLNKKMMSMSTRRMSTGGRT